MGVGHTVLAQVERRTGARLLVGSRTVGHDWPVLPPKLGKSFREVAERDQDRSRDVAGHVAVGVPHVHYQHRPRPEERLQPRDRKTEVRRGQFCLPSEGGGAIGGTGGTCRSGSGLRRVGLRTTFRDHQPVFGAGSSTDERIPQGDHIEARRAQFANREAGVEGVVLRLPAARLAAQARIERLDQNQTAARFECPPEMVGCLTVLGKRASLAFPFDPID